MTAELISVGTEILLGNIVNTNAAFLSQECAKLGLSVYHQCVVGDNEDRLLEALKMALKRSDIVILTGGLGPPKDDM
ncbi:MAG: molybdopterin-binding protein, partial [Acetivibrio ethanolgignens]